jgi:Raf kinase inhibitor-like YbhB/YbcL family protein
MGSKKIWIIFVVLLVLGISLYLLSRSSTKPPQTLPSTSPVAKEVTESLMQISSVVFEDQASIPPKYTCDAENISPPLTFVNVPESARSLVLIVDDPDAPAGDWVHWLVWNLDPKLGGLSEGQAPSGAVQGLNDFGKNNYGGPCPPSGTHRYQFKLYALDTSLNLSPQAKKKDLLAAIEGHILEQAILVGLYQKQ